MRQLFGAALVAALLFGCAATPQPRETAQAPSVETCQGPTAAGLREELPKAGIKLVADLEGEPFDRLKAFLAPHMPEPIPGNVDRAMIFQKGDAGLVVFLAGDCAIGHAAGPWKVFEQFLGTPI